MGSLYRIIDMFFNILEILIVVRILFSFLRINPYNGIGRIVHELTEPILGPIRKLIYSLGINTGMLDFSPIITVFLLRLISKGLKSLIFWLMEA